MIDHTQNVNARNFDNFAKGKTSIKLFHPPGGEDHLQLGWDYDEPEELNIKKKQEPKKPRYEPAFVMPKKEYTKSYHANKYIVDEDEAEKIKKYKLQKKKSFSNEQQKIKPNTKNENTKKAIEEIKEVIEYEEEQKKTNIKPLNKDEDDLTKGGRIMIFNMGK
jgi:hypothetical protein